MFKQIGIKKKRKNPKKIDRKKLLKYLSYIGIFLVSLLCVLYVLLPKPNDRIKQGRSTIFENINPNFKVGFGDKQDISKQYIRFDGSVSIKNPFEDKEVTFFDRIKGLFVTQKGFEMMLSSVRWGDVESENTMLDNIRPIAVDLGVDSIETSTQVTQQGREFGKLPSDEPVSKDTVVNRDIYPGIDLEYQIIEGRGFKEEIVIRDMELYLSSCKESENCLLPLNQFVFDFRVDEGVKINEYDTVSKDGVTPPYYLTDKEGRYIAHFLPTYAIDGAYDRTNSVDMVINHVEGNNYEIVVTLDPLWLFSIEREFPIRIDPSIVHDTKTEFDAGTFERTESLDGPKVQIKSDDSFKPDSDTEGYWKMDNSVTSVIPSDSNLQGYWDLVESSGSGAYILDKSNNTNNGTPTGTTFTGGKIAGGRNYASAGDTISIPNHSSIAFERTNSFSIEAWIKTTSTQTSQTIVSKMTNAAPYRGYELSLYQGKLHFVLINTWTSNVLYVYDNVQNLNDGRWHHVVATYNGTSLASGAKLYVDGSEKTTTIMYNSLSATIVDTSTLAIGSRSGALNFVGRLDEIGIYNKVLSSAEVLARYNAGFDILDSSGNDKHGMSDGLAWFQGKLSGGRVFNGTTDYIDIGSGYSLSLPLTLSVWVYPDFQSGFAGGVVISTNNMTHTVPYNYTGAWMGINMNGGASMNYGDNTGCGPTNRRSFNTRGNTITKRQWYHLVGIIRGATDMEMYVNGVKVAGEYTGTGGNMAYIATRQGSIGGVWNCGSYDWVGMQGSIDDALIIDRELSLQEILSIYKAGVGNHSGSFTSSSVDFQESSLVDSLSWLEYGVNTSDGETPFSTSSLLAQWDFNETSGTVASSGGSCGSSCNGTLYNMTTTGQDIVPLSGWTDNNKKFGSGSLMFDGTNDYVSMGTTSTLRPTTSLSVETWVKPIKVSGNQYLVSTGRDYYGSGYSLYLKEDSVWLQVNTDNVDDGCEINFGTPYGMIRSGEWTHIVATYSSTAGGSIYLNGSLVITDPISGSIVYRSGQGDNFVLGMLSFSSGVSNYYPFNGVMDSTRLYNRILSAAEIQSNSQLGNIEFQYKGSDDGNTWSDWMGGEEHSIQNLQDNEMLDVVSEGLVSYWPMDETTGTTVNDIVGSNDGATTGSGVKIVQGKHGNARGFPVSTTSTDRVQIPHDSSLSFERTNKFTISLWVKSNGPTTTPQTIFSKMGYASPNTGYDINMVDGKVRIHLTSTWSTSAIQVTGSTLINDGRWYHVVLAYSGNSLASGVKIYVNGKLETMTVGNNNLTTSIVNTVPVIIGDRYDSFSTGRNLDGTVDAVAVYNRELSSSEVQKLYNVGSMTPSAVNTKDSTISIDGNESLQIASMGTLLDSNTVAHWTLDQASGSGAYLLDSSPFGNNATPTVGTSYTKEGVVNGARYFDGTDDYISVPSGFADFTTGLTIEFWAKPTASNSFARFIDFGNGAPSNNFLLYRQSTTNDLVFYTFNGGTGTSMTITDGIKNNIWSHYAATLDGSGNAKVYRDGAQIGSSTLTALANITRNNNYIGKSNWIGDAYYKGYIDNVKISNRVRNPFEIAESYRQGRDHYVNLPIDNTPLSSNSTLSLNVASDKPGSNMEAIVGNSYYSNYQPDEDTVGLWHFDERSTYLTYNTDSSGYKNHAYPSSTFFAAESVLGGSRIFDGTSSYAAVSDSSSLRLATNMTIELWFRTHVQHTTSGDLIRKDTLSGTRYFHRIFINSNNLVASYYNGTDYQVVYTNAEIWNGAWHHMAMSISGTTMSLYYDGQLVGKTTIGGTQGVPTGEMDIGSCAPWSGGGRGYFFNGAIDEVRISKVARTPQEIRESFEVGKRTYPIKVDFGAELLSSNLITGSTDLSFSIDERYYGATNYIENLNIGDKIIVREFYGGTEYIAQGTVSTLNSSTGAITVSSWDSVSTFPSGGYTVNAAVFKWQEEYIDVREFPESINIDGVLDTTFDSSDGTNGIVYTTAIQSDGKIIIGGEFTTYGGTTRQYVARLNSDGSLDTSFDSSSGANAPVRAIAVQSDGKIIIGGEFTTYAGTTRQYVARLNSDGSLDTSFDSSSGANGMVGELSIQSDGKVLIGGEFTTYAGTTRQYIARLNSNGSLDTSFNSSSGASSYVRAIAIQSDGKILIAGVFTTYASVTRQRVARLNSDGSLDTSFDSSSGANDSIETLAIQSDGKVVIGGNFTGYAGTTRLYVARLSSSGSLDTGFGTTSGVNTNVYTLAIQSDGKVVIGGAFTSFSGIARQYIARLESDGDLDTTFNSSTGANSSVEAMTIQSDGKVVIGGNFTSFGGVPREYVARLNASTLSKIITFRTLAETAVNYWIDDIRTATYLSGGDIASEEFSSVNPLRYFQYKVIFTSKESNLTPYLTQVQLDYTLDAPTMDKLMRHGKWFDSQGVKRDYWWAQ